MLKSGKKEMWLETGSSICVPASAPGFAVDGEKAGKAAPSAWKVSRAHTEGRADPAGASGESRGSPHGQGEQGAAENVCITHPVTATFVWLCWRGKLPLGTVGTTTALKSG